MAENSIAKFVDYTQVINNDYRILYFDIKSPYPTPLQWTFVINEFNENIRVLKKLDCKIAFVLNLKLVGLLSTDYILEFIKILESLAPYIESKLIATSVIYEGILINKMFDLIKMFYKTKKPIDFVLDMRKAVHFIDSHNKIA